jgi:hypothetical protein
MEFFPYQAAGLTGRAESGTAGPFDMGESFIAFRDSFRYAWVGVDGAVGLSKTPDDTVEIGDFLYGNPAPPGSAPYGLLFVPGTMIAPLLSERTLVDSTHQGVIRIGNNSDSCLFVVEWDSVPGRGLSGSTAPLTFQAILDRCSGQIRFQYDDAGNIAADPPGIVAVKSDSSQNTGPDPGMLLANERGAPAATRPGDRPCITLVPTIGGVVREGWNLLALSMAPAGGPELLTTLFPTAVSDAFRFFDGYVEAETLDAGTGFWLKFPKEAAVGYVGGEPVDSLTIPVVAGWNIIGGPSCPLPVGAVTPVGTDIVSSFFDYGFSKGWTHAQTLQPGIGYWVKVSGPGFLEMKCPP